MLHSVLVVIVIVLTFFGIKADEKNTIKIIVIALVILVILQICFGYFPDSEYEITE